MIEQQLPYVPEEPDLSREEYLAKVVIAYLREISGAASNELVFDGAICDGYCLADDIEAAFKVTRKPQTISTDQL